MKLASLKEDGRDGRLIVVSRDLARGLRVHDIAPTLQHALDDWVSVEPKLRAASGWLNRGPVAGAFEFDPSHCARSEEHTSELQSHLNIVCRLLLEKKNARKNTIH